MSREAYKNLSICMIVKNEEKNIEKCISSFQPVADEVIVVDTGSSDNTVEIASRYSSKVIQSKWRDDFSYSRNISIDHARGPWCLWIDADDRLPVSEVEKIQKLKTMALDRAFKFRISIPVDGGFCSEFMQTRMFPLHRNLRFEKPIHEDISISLRKNNYPIYDVDVNITHLGYANQEMKRKKALRNLRILNKNLNKYKHQPLYISQIGDVYSILKEYDKAIEYYEKALDNPFIKHGASELYRQLPVRISQMYKNLGKFDEAIKWLDTAFMVDSHSIHALYLRGEIAEESEDLSTALDCYKKILSIPEQVNSCLSSDKIIKAKVHVLIGRLENKLGRYEKAKDWFLNAIDKYPSMIDSYHELGDVFLKQGELTQAVHYFGKSLSISQDFSPVPLIGMAKICNALNKHKEKNIFINKLTANFPNDERTTSAVKELS